MNAGPNTRGYCPSCPGSSFTESQAKLDANCWLRCPNCGSVLSFEGNARQLEPPKPITKVTETKPLGFEVRLNEDGELDEAFARDAFVHIERMDTTSFWIGINLPDGQMMHVRTGVERGVWFFNIEEDKEGGGFWHQVQRPRGLKIEAAARKAKVGKNSGG